MKSRFEASVKLFVFATSIKYRKECKFIKSPFIKVIISTYKYIVNNYLSQEQKVVILIYRVTIILCLVYWIAVFRFIIIWINQIKMRSEQNGNWFYQWGICRYYFTCYTNPRTRSPIW